MPSTAAIDGIHVSHRTGGSSVDEADDLRAELRRVGRAGRLTNLALWAVAGGVMVIAAWAVTAFAVAHGLRPQVAWALDPLTGTALLVALQSDAVLGRHGVRASGWGVALRLVAGASTWTMNVWQAVAGRDAAAVVLHSVPPALLVVLAEAAPHYRRQFAALGAGLQGRLDRLAVAAQLAAERTADAAQHRATEEAVAAQEQQRAEAAERLALLKTQQAQADASRAAAQAGVEQARLAAHAAVEVARADADRAAADAQRVRLTAEQQRREERDRHRAGQRPGRQRAAADSGPTGLRLVVPGQIERRMRAHWNAERTAGRLPTGAELDRIAGTKDYGRKLRRQLLAEEASHTGTRATAIP